MSVAELAPREDFERTPPHDIAAEQCVLGGMMLSKDAISDVLEVIRATDHYRPAHQIVHEVILDLYGKGEPADAVTVAAELTKRGDIGKVGGAPYLHTLIASVPTAANAGYYARIVSERAVLRRLVEVGTRIVQLGYAGDGDADELVDRAQAEVYGITERRVSDDYQPLSEIMTATLVELEAIDKHDGGLTGVPTGFADLDSLTNGLHPGQMIVIAARPALGKALALDTPMPTPAGWTTMADVVPGDELIGADGRPVLVLAASEVMHDRLCFEVEFSDGERIVADGEHMWTTWSRAARWHAARRPRWPAVARGRDWPQPQVQTTAEIAARLQVAPGGRLSSHAVAQAAALELPSATLPVAPYVAGVWLARGQAGPAGLDPEIGLRLADFDDSAVAPEPAALEFAALEFAALEFAALGTGQERRIPVSYLRADADQRRALLAGLLDVIGEVSESGAIDVVVSERSLAGCIRELVLGLGHQCTLHPADAASQVGLVGPASADDPADREAAIRLSFRTDDEVFGVSAKQHRHKERQASGARPPKWRYIVAVRAIPSRPVRCVQVDSADQLYLAGRAMIPTHNSTLALDLARAASIKHGLPSVIFSLEMSRNEITMRLLSAEARVALSSMRTGKMTEDDWMRLARRMSEVAHAPMYIDDSPNMSMMEIRAKCRRLKQRHDLRLVIIDYLQLMTSPKRVENRQQEVSDMSRSLKLLAKELNVPVIAVAQLNRGPEQRTDKRPMLSDLRESGCLTEDTTLLRADTGAPISLRELMNDDSDGILVWSVDSDQRLVSAPITKVFSSGIKEVYRLRLATGREVKASGNHPFLTPSGWLPLDELTPGARVAIPRRIPQPIGGGLGWTEHRLGLLAHLIGDGCVLSHQPLHYTSNDEANLDFVEQAAIAEFGITPRRVRQQTWWHSYLPAPYRCGRGRYNPIRSWFMELGIDDLRSYRKRIPAVLYSASDQEIAQFLRHLWATDGCVAVPRSKTAPKVYYASTSRELADGVAALLARFGIVARIRQLEKVGYRPSFHVIVADSPSLRVFCTKIGVYGRRRESVAELLDYLDGSAANTNADTLPIEIWNLVKAERIRAELTERQFQAAIGTNYCGSTLYKSCPSRERLMRCADVLDSAVLREFASSDIYWDRIVEIESLGPQPVFDATVKGTHNFIADGVFAHNSIEQDADVVILLHREDAYERESPRAGEADFIVAKHRNGPTTTVTVAFQGHYSRFVDMARL